MVSSEHLQDRDECRVVIRPNQSASWRQSMLFLAAIALPLLTIAVVMATQGLWLILPFAGLELAVLFVALYVVSHAARRCEVVSVTPSQVTVEKGRNRSRCQRKGGPEQRFEFVRAWVRVELSRNQARRLHPRQVWIGASGHRVELGNFLNDDEKAALASELKRLLSCGSPAQVYASES